MAIGKIFSIIAGLLTLIATYLLSLAAMNDGGTLYYVYGIGMSKNLPKLFTDAQSLGNILGILFFVIYIIAILIIWFLSSGIIQLAGAKSRVSSIIGSIMPLFLSIAILYYSFTVVPIEWVVNVFGDSEPLIEGIIPFHFVLGGTPEAIGVYILLAGGILGFIAGILPREQKYEY